MKTAEPTQSGKGKAMTDFTMTQLQTYLRQKYPHLNNGSGLFMKLVEEMGETAEVLNLLAGRKNANGTAVYDAAGRPVAVDSTQIAQNNTETQQLKTQLARELADLIHYTVAIAAVEDLDLTATILEKDRSASLRYAQNPDLLTFLEQQQTNPSQPNKKKQEPKDDA